MSRKRWLYLFLLFALFALLILASGLSAVHFSPGKPFGAGGSLFPAQNGLNNVVKQISEIPLWKQIVFCAALLVSFLLFAFLLPPEMRKRIILLAIRFVLVVGIVFYLIKNQLIKFPGLNFNFANPSGTLSANQSLGFDASHFSPPVIAPWIRYLVSLGVSLALLALMWAAYRFWTRFRVPHPARQLDELVSTVRSSLDGLANGREFEDVIIQMYASMSDIVAIKRGLRRADATTPREFADRLSRAGLPADAVARLTRLFESVRYGKRKSTQADVSEATACLNSILDYCGGAR